MTPEQAAGLCGGHPLADRTAVSTLPSGPVEIRVRHGGGLTVMHEVHLRESWVVHVTEDWEHPPFRGTDLTESWVVLVGRLARTGERGEMYLVTDESAWRRPAVEQALSDVVADHPMWEGVEFSGEREAAIAAFVAEAAERVLAL